MNVRLLVPPEAPPGLLEGAAGALPAPFTAAEVRQGMPLDPFLDHHRAQVDAARALEAMPQPERGWTALLLTAADLFVPALTYVFGLSHLGGRRGLLSWARLKPEASEAALGVTLSRRLTVEMTHELGHSVGLVHCARADCPMHRSLWPEAVDMKGIAFCDECRAELRKLGVAQ